MKNITLISSNGISRTFAAADDDTLRDILSHQDVVDFFDAEDGDEVIENLSGMNDAMVAEGQRGMIVRSVPDDGDVFEIDLDSDQEAAEEGTDAADADTAVPGIVTVITGGGMQSTNIPIIVGRTTVREAIYSDTVRARSGMSDAQLSNCTVTINQNTVNPSVLDSRTLSAGDVIALNPRTASTKGC